MKTNKFLFYVMLISIITSCTEKGVIVEVQQPKVRIDTTFVYKVKFPDGTVKITQQDVKLKQGDIIDVVK